MKESEREELTKGVIRGLGRVSASATAMLNVDNSVKRGSNPGNRRRNFWGYTACIPTKTAS